jgi:uncharacterized protein YjdB
MRALSSIPVLLSVLLSVPACDSGPTDVTVEPSLSVRPTQTTIAEGETIQLSFDARDSKGQPAAPNKVVWATSNPKVATVSPGGLVTGHEKGAAEITALWGSAQARSTINVVDAVPAPIPCSTDGLFDRAGTADIKDHPDSGKRPCIGR